MQHGPTTSTSHSQDRLKKKKQTSNYIQIGPRKWISAQVFIFGLLATMQVFLRNRGAFLAIRLLLGFAEAGYIPGAVYTLSTWYTRGELAKRVAVFFFGMFGGNAVSPLLASGILLLDGRRGVRGWQWLFLSILSLSMQCAMYALFNTKQSKDSSQSPYHSSCYSSYLDHPTSPDLCSVRDLSGFPIQTGGYTRRA